MSTKLMSHSTETSSPILTRASSHLVDDNTSSSLTHNQQSLSRKNSEKSTPSFIITDTSKLDTLNRDEDLDFQQKAKLLSPPTFFNVKRENMNNQVLPPTVNTKTPEDLNPEFLTDANTIVIDVRPYTSYLKSRLVNSLNICVPTTLLKRKTFVLKNIVGSMQKVQQDYINVKLENNDKLDFVLYDDFSSSTHCSFHLYQTCLKILDFIRETNKECNISILQNGISTVDSKSPILDRSEVPMLSPLSPTFPDSARSSVSPTSNKSADSASASPNSVNFCFTSLSGFSLPSAKDFSSSFAASIKKNRVEASNIGSNSENNIVHLPEGSKLSPARVPNWLTPFLDPVQGYKTVQEKFIKIEDIENNRLEGVARLNIPGADNNISCCTGGVCSPSAPCPDCDQIRYTLPEGIEYGDKNRYSNIWPYEHSRVKILHSPQIVTTSLELPAKNVHKDDYFNANYVTVPRISKNKYIATQAPLPSTFDDFWRAVWYNEVEIIICLTNLDEGGMRKSDNYWKSKTYESGLDVKLLSDTYDKDSNTVVRTLQLQKTSGQTQVTSKKLVKQIEFKSWPDFGVPPTERSIIKLIQLKDSFVNDRKAPIVVHCSAGCGRTGTFITIDVLLQMFWSTVDSPCLSTPAAKNSPVYSPFGQLDKQLMVNSKINDFDRTVKKLKFWGDDDLIYKTVNILRRQRLSMVQTLSQYLMCYETILAAINDSYQDEPTS